MLPTNTQQDVLDLSQGRGGPRSSWTMTSLMVIGLLGTAMAGYDTAVVSGTIDFMAESLKFPRKDDTFQRTAVVASTTICAMLSACAQVLSTTGQSFGRRPVLCAGILLHFVGTTMCVFATEYWFLIAGRSVVGLGAGFIFVVLPMYLGECSAASSRGSAVASLDLFIVLGQVVAAIVNVSLQELLPDKQDLSWRLSYAFIILPALVCLILILLDAIPESPRVLLLRGEIGEAEKALIALFGNADDLRAIQQAQLEERNFLLKNGCLMASPQKEEAELLEAQLAQRSGELAPTPALDTRPRDTSSGPQAVKALVDDKVSGADESSKTSSSVAVLFDASVQQQPLVTLWYFWTLPGFKRLRRAMRAGLGLTLLNQLTGINTVMLFGATVVQGMGYSLHAAIWATVLLCLTQAVGVFIAVWQIDGAGGRRFVALRSCALMCLSLVLLSASASTTATSFTSSDQDKGKFNIQSLAMPALLLYLFAFGVGLSPLCWVYNVEVYPTSARNLCSDQAFLLNIACTSLVSSSFLPMKNAIGLGGVFAMFGAVAAIGGIFVYLYLDETAGKTLEELEQEVLRSTSTSNAASGEENEALLQQYSFSGKRK